MGIVHQLENERKKFLSLFPMNKLSHMKVDDFVIGKGPKTFCYWLENKLKGLGDIHGATAYKFGIYYGRTKSDSTVQYRFTHRFGTTADEVFKNVKTAILSLLQAGKKNDSSIIQKNPISPMFKGKILSTYFPDRFLNIFTKDHLDYFLDKLDVVYSDSLDEIAKRVLLMKFKHTDTVMKKWSIYEFSKFLYEKFGKPTKGDNIPQVLKKFIIPKYPPINKVKPDYIELTVSPLNGKKRKGWNSTQRKIDFEKETRINKKIGERGELIVLIKEKEYLKSIGRDDLSIKIRHISKEMNSAGYDILSYDNSGNEKYIEVKSTKQKISNANFLISSNEYNVAKRSSNYYIYIVFEACSKKPKICRLKNPFLLPRNKIKIIPTSYRVFINLK